jgi:hypothetical protein
MSGEEGAAYAVQILDASFKLCLQKPNAGVLMAHSKLLANGTSQLWLYSPLDREAILKDVLTHEYMAVPLANSLLWAINTPALVF